MKRTDFSIAHLKEILDQVEKELVATCDTMDSIRTKSRYLILICIALFTSLVGFIYNLPTDSIFILRVALLISLLCTSTSLIILIYSSRSFWKYSPGTSFKHSFDPEYYNEGIIKTAPKSKLDELRHKYFLLFTLKRSKSKIDLNRETNHKKVKQVKLATWILVINLICPIVYSILKLLNVWTNLMNLFVGVAGVHILIIVGIG